jgi:ubiquinone biosynthesis protein UbiJ
VPRFYSSEWVEQFNRAVAGFDTEAAALGEASLAAGERAVRVAQVIRGVPARTDPLTVTLVVADGRLHLELDGAADGAAPDVTVLLDYADAAAMSRGDLTPAEAIATGRLRVRGDLSVLVAVHGLLAAAGPRLAGLSDQTDYGAPTG